MVRRKREAPPCSITQSCSSAATGSTRPATASSTCIRPTRTNGSAGFPRPRTTTSTGRSPPARHAFDHGPWPRMAPTERAEIVQKLADLVRRAPGRLRARSSPPRWARRMLFSHDGPGADAPAHAAVLRRPGPHLSLRGAPRRRARPDAGAPRARRRGRGDRAVERAAVRARCRRSPPRWCPARRWWSNPRPRRRSTCSCWPSWSTRPASPRACSTWCPRAARSASTWSRIPGVDKIAFTGSTAAGRRIASLCGERLQPVQPRARREVRRDRARRRRPRGDGAGPRARLADEQRPGLRGPDPHPRPTVSLRRGGRRGLGDWPPASWSATRRIRRPALGPLVAERQRDRVEGYIQIGPATKAHA